MTFATDGLITRVIDVGASDKLVNIITHSRGRIGVMVKGGRSPNSKLTAISQLFTYGNFEIYEKNSMYWLRGGSITNSFYNLSTDVSKVALAAYLCDLANELTDEDELFLENYARARAKLKELKAGSKATVEVSENLLAKLTKGGKATLSSAEVAELLKVLGK